MAKKTIGLKIKEFRKKNNLTQDALAKSLGYYDKSVISHIEKGDADMTYEKINLLLKVYNLDPNDLFDLDSQNNKKKVAIYIHGLHGSHKEAEDFAFLKDEYDVFGLKYKDANPWELKNVIQREFKKLTKNYDEVVVIANSIGAFYACEYLSDFNIQRAFFISPIVSMFQNIVDLMTMYGIKDKTLKRKKIIELEDGNTLSFDFYQHVSNDEDHWNVPTDILYGAYDEVVYTGSMLEFLENHPLARLTVKSESEHYFQSEEEKEFIKDWMLRLLKQN